MLEENPWVTEMAPCLEESLYRDSARHFVEESLQLGHGNSQNVLRALASISLFKEKVRIENSSEHPLDPFNHALHRHAQLLRGGRDTLHILPVEIDETENIDDVVESTGRHFGALFSGFDDETYFDDGLQVVSDRLNKNDFPIDRLQGKSALDAGCGGGRYSVALKGLGLGQVTGVDMSDTGLADGKERVARAGITEVEFKKGNVLDLPFPDETFDFVWSSGVVHHTSDIQKGVCELLRVLRKGGCGYLYIIENPGGIFWDTIELLRILLRNVSFEFAQLVYRMAGVSSYDTFYILDHVQVPINIRSTPEESEELLEKAGARNIRRLTRGTSFDRVELIYNNQPYADIKYGVGENRYYFEK